MIHNFFDWFDALPLDNFTAVVCFICFCFIMYFIGLAQGMSRAERTLEEIYSTLKSKLNNDTKVCVIEDIIEEITRMED